MLSTTKWSALLPPLFLFVFTFLLYLHNLSTGVYGGDVGDLVSAAVVRGVPHPPGYPLFTLLGIISMTLPFHASVAWKVGLVSSLASSLGVVVMYFLSNLLVRNKLISTIAAMTLAFFYNFWLYAEVAEVFGLHHLFVLLLFFFAVSYSIKKERKYLYFLSFFTGLSLTHQHFIILLFPALFMLILLTNWRVLISLKTLSICLILFFFGLLPYIYVPLAASHNPPINWNNPSTVDNFLHLVLRRDYGASPNVAVDTTIRLLTIKTYFQEMVYRLTPPVLLLIVLGVLEVIRKKKYRLFFSIFLAFFFSGPFYIVYSSTTLTTAFTIGVLERLYTTSFIVLFLLLPLGISLVSESLYAFLAKKDSTFKKKPYYKNFFASVFFLIPMLLLLYNFPKTDLSAVSLGDNLAKDVIVSLPKRSVVLLSGDTVLFDVWYLYYGLQIRQDLKVMNLYRLSQDDRFLQKRKIIQKDTTIAEDSLDLKTIVSFADTRPLFSLSNLQYSNTKYGQLSWFPYGLVFKYATEEERLMSKEEFLAQQERLLHQMHIVPGSIITRLSEKGLSISEVPGYYAQGYVNTANHLVAVYKDKENAKRYYDNALKIYPDAIGAYNGLGYYYLDKKNCQKAEEYFLKNISLKPGDKTVYLLLYATYDGCFKDQKKAAAVAVQFQRMFSTSLIDILKRQLKSLP